MNLGLDKKIRIENPNPKWFDSNIARSRGREAEKKVQPFPFMIQTLPSKNTVSRLPL